MGDDDIGANPGIDDEYKKLSVPREKFKYALSSWVHYAGSPGGPERRWRARAIRDGLEMYLGSARTQAWIMGGATVVIAAATVVNAIAIWRCR